ncbi:MAG: helix-turn-helix transcriptional regulator [Pseudomonadota bacterium]
MHPLEEKRKKNKLTMDAMGEKLGCGLSVYKSWIYGWRYPSAKNLQRIEEEVGVTPGELWEAYKARRPAPEAAE